MVDASAQRYSKIIICLGILAAFSLALFFWSIDKGFDITDEGFYALGYSFPAEYNSGFSSYNLIVSALLPAKHVALPGYRIASILAALVAAVFLSIGVWQWVRNKCLIAVPYWVVLLLLAIGNFLQYSISPRTTSYNTLNSLAIATLVGSVLYFCASPAAGRSNREYAFLALGGIFSGLDFFVKGSSSLAAFGTGGIVLVLSLGWQNFRQWTPPAAVAVASYLTGMLLFFSCIQPADVWYAHFTSEMRVLLSTHYDSGLLVKYLRDLGTVAPALVYPFSLIIIGVLVMTLMYRRRAGSLSPVLIVLASLFFAAVAAFGARRYGLYRSTHLNGNNSAVWFLVILLVVIVIFIALADKSHYRKINRRNAVIAVWLFALPFICSIGTINNIFINVLIEINYWLALMCILYANMPAAVTDKFLVKGLVFLLPALLIVEQYTYGLVLGPYGQAADMRRQTVPVTVGKFHKPTTLLLDPETAGFVTELRQTLRDAGFQPAMPIIAIYDLPGLVYLLDGISPGDPWLFGQRDARNCNALAKTDMRLKQAFLLVNEEPGQELLQCMRMHGLHFPQDYVKVRALANPYRHNLYNWRSYQDTVTVYAPAALLRAKQPALLKH